jgi:hypothetical protein
MVGARTVGVSRAALRSAVLMRRCQPGPRARKWAITSRSRRSETSCLVGAFCRPRERQYASTMSGMTSLAGRMRAHISSVRRGLSGSSAIPALISSSSSSVIVASWRSAFRRASRQALSGVFGISPHIALLRFPQTDDPDLPPAAREHQDVKPVAKEPDRDLPEFSIVLADRRRVLFSQADCSYNLLLGTVQ